MLHRGFWEKLTGPIIGLAPMDGVTDAAFRYMVCKYSKPSVVITEFTNVEGLARGNVKGLAAFIYNEIERPVVAQIFGVEPESYYKAAVMLCAMGFDGIDINMGCPVNKVAAKGSGAALIKTPELAKKLVRITQKGVKDWAEGITMKEAGVHEDMIAAVERMRGEKVQRASGQQEADSGSYWTFPGTEAESVKLSSDAFRCFPMLRSEQVDRNWSIGTGRSEQVDRNRSIGAGPGTEFQSGKSCIGEAALSPRRPIPVSIKTRIGYNSVVAEEWVKHLLEVEPANISMHGRTLKQLYMGQANWEEIAKAAQVVHQSGVGTSFLGNGDVKSMDDARGKILDYGVDGVLVGRAVFGNPWFFEGKEPTPQEGLLAAIEHAKYFEKLNRDGIQNIHFQHIRKHLGWYCKGFEGAKDLRIKLMQAESAEEVERKINGVLSKR